MKDSPFPKDTRPGLVHLYFGDGKGKTTAGVGLAVRARGAGLRVGFFQFMKGRESGECAMLEAIGVTVAGSGGGSKFVFQMTADEKKRYAATQRELFEKVVKNAAVFDLLVLDELLDAINEEMIPEEAVAAFLDGKPEGLEVAMTGRNPSAELTRRADYVSEVRCLCHPYRQGVAARRGIEF